MAMARAAAPRAAVGSSSRSCPQLAARRPARGVGSAQLRTGRRAVVVRAAAAGGASADPYSVLGLQPGADSQAVQRQYNKLTREHKGNEAMLSSIEAAHTSIMMSQLTNRMQGGMKVDKEVAYADRAVYFPWRPRLCVDERKAILRNLAASAVIAAWIFFFADTSFTQPLLFSTALAMVGHYVKQCGLYPTGGQYATPEEKKNSKKNLIRAGGLGLFGMFAGMFFSVTLPDFVSAQMGKTLPYWFYEGQNMLLNLGGLISNFLLVSFFR